MLSKVSPVAANPAIIPINPANKPTYHTEDSSLNDFPNKVVFNSSTDLFCSYVMIRLRLCHLSDKRKTLRCMYLILSNLLNNPLNLVRNVDNTRLQIFTKVGICLLKQLC